MPRIPQPPSLESKSLKFGNKDPKVVAYKFPSNIPRWKNHWFYIKNYAPPTPKKIK
jgi:hypothetical protein